MKLTLKSATRFVVAIMLAPFLLSSCSSSKHEEQRLAIEKGMSALRRVQAAVEIGTTLPLYRQMLIETKVSIDDAARVLPIGGSLTYHLKTAISNYLDAAEFWQLKSTQQRYFDDDVVGHKLVQMYAAFPPVPDTRGFKSQMVDGKIILEGDLSKGVQHAWEFAALRIADAEKIVESGDYERMPPK